MKEYKVIKAFACAKKGDILSYNEDSELWEFDIKDGSTQRFMCMDEETAESFVEEGNLLILKDEAESICSHQQKFDDLRKFIDVLISQYTEDNNAVAEKYADGEIQPCVKVEADTVYYNLIKVLNRIKEEIEK
mgnify:CR=1 FL=1